MLDKLKESIMEEEVDSKGVEDQSKKVDNPDDAAELIKKIDKITKMKTNNILMLAYHQGIIFQKDRENNKFISAVKAFNISKATINFKIGIIKFIDDYPKMRKSCISTHYLKNNFRVCRNHANEFK